MILTISNARNDSITVTTTTITVEGLRRGKIIYQNRFHPAAPSTSEASITVWGIPFSPVKYKINEHVHRDEVSALIFFPPHFFLRDPNVLNVQNLLTRILQRIDNVVCLDEAILDLPTVIFDRVSAARVAVTHLVTLKHRRIGFVGAADDRLDGYRQALFEHEIPYDESLVQSPGLLNSPEEGYEGTIKLLEVTPRPTAIFAACDEVAVGILGALQDRGIRVPDDIALVSIDDIDIASIVRPALTTVRVPRRQMGVHALRILAMHEAYPDTHPASTVLRTELIVRQSCGAKP